MPEKTSLIIQLIIIILDHPSERENTLTVELSKTSETISTQSSITSTLSKSETSTIKSSISPQLTDSTPSGTSTESSMKSTSISSQSSLSSVSEISSSEKLTETTSKISSSSITPTSQTSASVISDSSKSSSSTPTVELSKTSETISTQPSITSTLSKSEPSTIKSSISTKSTSSLTYGQKEFYVTVVFDMKFNDDYLNQFSEAYISLKKTITILFYASCPQYGYEILSFIVVGFSPGSVKAEMKFVLKSNNTENLTYSNVFLAVNDSLNENYNISNLFATYNQNYPQVSASVSNWSFYVIGVVVFIFLVAISIVFCQVYRYRKRNANQSLLNIEEANIPSFERRMSMLRRFTSEEILGDSSYHFQFDDSFPRTHDNSFGISDIEA